MTLEVVIASLPDRKNVVAEIWLDKTHLAEVSNEHGVIQIELSPIPQGREIKLSLEDYIAALTRAGRKMDFW